MFLNRMIGALVAILLTATGAFAQDSYRIKPGDQLSVEVLEDSSLNRTVVVLPDGRFSFPFAGSVRAGGRTVSQVRAAVRAAIASNFAVDPTVFVAVTPLVELSEPDDPKADLNSIYFLGEIASPGLREVEPGTTLLQALSQAGGFTNFAATKRLQLRRTNSKTGLQSVFQIDYDALSNGAALRNDFPLHDGDVILVPERRLFE